MINCLLNLRLEKINTLSNLNHLKKKTERLLWIPLILLGRQTNPLIVTNLFEHAIYSL